MTQLSQRIVGFGPDMQCRAAAVKPDCRNGNDPAAGSLQARPFSSKRRI
jgi:hypothetical protein